MATLVQSKTASAAGVAAGASWSVTLDAAPTAGNLLVVVGCRRSSSAQTPAASGFTAGPQAAGSNSSGLDWKVATGGMSATISGTWVDGGGSNDWTVTVMEFAPSPGASWGATPIDGTGTYQNTGSVFTIPLAATLVGSGNGVAVACAQQNWNTTFTNDGGYTELVDGRAGQSADPSNNFLYKLLTPLSSQSFTITSPNNAQVSGVLALFLETAGAGSQARSQAVFML